ncbi:ester cyclase [Amycolatopsis speibonae]|uniref:Ester cyclase n=1 Tax=Amycolatopsis speibonae TaxID=1450224 RepID=A0ABV7NSH9_9PSEU
MTSVDISAEKERYTNHVAEFRRRVFVPGSLDDVREFVHDDVVDHFAPDDDPGGVAGFAKRFSSAKAALKAHEIEVVASSYDGDVLFQAILLKFEHTGEFMGMKATGKRFAIGGMDAFRFRDGKIAEHWGVYDVSKIPDLLVGTGESPGGWSTMWPKPE